MLPGSFWQSENPLVGACLGGIAVQGCGKLSWHPLLLHQPAIQSFKSWNLLCSTCFVVTKATLPFLVFFSVAFSTVCSMLQGLTSDPVVPFLLTSNQTSNPVDFSREARLNSQDHVWVWSHCLCFGTQVVRQSVLGHIGPKENDKLHAMHICFRHKDHLRKKTSKGLLQFYRQSKRTTEIMGSASAIPPSCLILHLRM